MEVRLHAGGAPDDAPPLETTTPSEAGTFSFGGLQPGAYTVQFALRGFYEAQREATVRVGGVVDVGMVTLFAQVDAEDAGVLRGRALLQGAPGGGHGGTLVQPSNAPFLTQTLDDGRFELPLPEGTYTLRVSHAGYGTIATDRIGVAAGEPTELEGEIVLPALPGRVQGRVVLPARKDTLENRRAIEVTLVDGDEATADPTARPSTETRAFVFEGALPGVYDLHVRLDGFEPYDVEGVLVPPGGAADVRDLRLEEVSAIAHLTGQAELAGHDNHQDIQVELEGELSSARTTRQGFFELEVPAREAPYTLVFSHPGYDDQRVPNLPGLGPDGRHALDEVVVLTAQPGRVHGRVHLDIPPGHEGEFGPDFVTRVTVRLSEAGGGAPREASPDDEGEYAFEGVAPGSYTLRFSVPGFRNGFGAADVGPGTRVNAGVTRLISNIGAADVPPSFIEGTVLLECAGVCDHGGIRVETHDAPFATLTTANGSYRLQVIEGRFHLAFRSPGYQTEERVGPVDVPEGQGVAGPVGVVLSLDPGSVSGEVHALPPQGPAAPLPGASVAIYEGEALRDTRQSDASGAFVIGGLRAGVYRLEITAPGHRPDQVVAAVSPGETTRIGRRTLDLARGTLRGVLSRPDGARTGGASVEVRGVGHVWSTSTSAGDDAFRIAGLPTGAYDLTATAPGFTTLQRAGVAVAADQETVLAGLALERRRYAVTAEPRVVQGDATLVFDADADLDRVRVWHEGQPPPPTFQPLQGPEHDRWTLPLAADGEHRLFAELANAAYADDDVSNDRLADVTPVLGATVRRDATRPQLAAVRHVPADDARAGYSAQPRVTVALDGFDPAPASGLTRIRLRGPDGDRTLDYTPRFGLDLPAPGESR